MPSLLPDNLDALRRRLPERSLAVLVDIDGTISPIVASPDDAHVEPRCRAALQLLSERLPLVAALSGRPAAAAASMLGVPQMVYVGNHGLERWECGQVVPVAAAADLGWAVQAAALRLGQGALADGVVIEHKGLTLSVHHRNARDPQAAHRATLEAILPAVQGLPLRVREGRQVIEIFPDLAVHKGTAVEALLTAYTPDAAIYFGDDTTDVDAFQALHTWGQATKRWVAAVAVLSDEAPKALVDQADYTAEGVAEVCAALHWLAGLYGPR